MPSSNHVCRAHGFPLVCLALLLGALSGVAWLRGDDAPSPSAGKSGPTTAKEALAKFNDLIGGWRGIAQPRRGSTQGAWQEEAEWVWEFGKDKGDIAIRYDVKDGKLLKSARLTYDGETKQYVVTANSPDDETLKYTGQWDGNKLVLESEPDPQDEVHRITVTRLNEKRTLVLHEKRQAAQQTFFRVAEVGYTRAGTRLAFNTVSGPECIVTGGAGTIPVSYMGKTYYVCCTGCKQAFEDDPEGVLADAAERHEKERLEREKAR